MKVVVIDILMVGATVTEFLGLKLCTDILQNFQGYLLLRGNGADLVLVNIWP